MKTKLVNEYLNTLNINRDIKNIADITTLIKSHLKHYCFSSAKVLLIVDEEIRSLRNNRYIKIKENQELEIDISSLEKFSKVIENDFNAKFSKKEFEYLFNSFVK